MADGHHIVAHYIRDMNWGTLPDAVQQQAKLCLLDNLGAVLGGTLTPISSIAASYASDTWRGNEATILLHSRRAQAAGAAFANACAGNGLDIDDDAIFTRGHPGAQLLPVVLAVAEKVGAGGKALLEAMVIGYEIAIRTGRCWHDHHEIYQGDGAWGSVANAAAAARLLGLNENQIKHVLGIAEYFSPNAPLMRDIENPTMVKHGIGWGAMVGVTAAELAQKGFTGIPSILGFERYEDWVADIGDHYWMIEGVFYKAWASCAWGHAACVAALRLVKENDVLVDDIVHIEVRTFEEAIRLYKGLPTTTEEAQFSVQWPLACLLLDGELGPKQILEDRFSDPAVRALVDRIELVLDPEMDKMYDSGQDMDLRMYSRVKITLKDGRQLDSGIVERGADEWDAASLEHKFRWLVGHVLDPLQIDRLVQMVWNFDSVKEVGELTRQLIKSSGSSGVS